ncbi:cell division site-positioning protein MapZ family protein [Streptococcus anginosus]|uniref:cell division site-positioning protein MapZ family protein n=1 Tax=Streptococcus anginosus TaxID=1328 RepID=UPI00195642E5|nr:cell division site-positioning protein MapZ family protein [Streptococcus anginosus]VTY29917.1 Mid-cell-anchored protein Z [Streptococcus anginosus]
MSKDEKHLPEQEEKESILDFETAKEMTIGQAARKSEELEAGVTEEDNVLDKYIKQHRQEIEAGKFSAQSAEEMSEAEDQEQLSQLDLAEFIQEMHDEVQEEALLESAEVASEESAFDETVAALAASEAEPQETSEENSTQTPEELEAETKIMEPIQPEMDDIPVSSTESTESYPTFTALDEEMETEKVPFYKNKKVLYSAASVALLALIGGTVYLSLNRKQAKPATNSTSQTSKSSTTSSSENKDLKAFNNLYDSFFTDANKLALKNSSFGNLDKLKVALEKLKNTNEYNVAKAKYDSLVKQVEAVQNVNAQFTSAAITDGVLDTKAKVKADAKFTDVTTGNTDLDKVLKSAIGLGKNQQTSAPQSEAAAAPSQSSAQAPVAEQPASVPAQTTAPAAPASGANLQRHLSRVPYDQTKINDSNNPAWNFNPGVLEKILATSRERGYFTGDNYILERVNIINGNGYYNLFRTDGTYLFSINCKTGYFVGNGAGYADALDY